jgi:hypothetical protein
MEGKIKIDDALGKVHRILLANNELSITLYMNIQMFATALNNVQELKRCQDGIKNMQEQINKLKQRIDCLIDVSPTVTNPIKAPEKLLFQIDNYLGKGLIKKNNKREVKKNGKIIQI